MPSGFFIFVAVIQLVLLLGHLFTYWTIRKLGGITDPGTVWWLRVGAILLSLSFVAASLVAMRSHHPLVQWFYTFAAAWLGTFYWLLLASLTSWLLVGLARLLHAGFSNQGVLYSLVGLSLLVSVYGLVNAAVPRLREIEVPLPNLPAAWEGKKLVLIADTHLGHVWGMGSARSVARRVAALKPEAVLIAGDFYDGPPADYAKLAAPYGLIKATYGVYFVSGNHEYFGDPSPYFAAARAGGMKPLVNEKVDLGGLQVVGVDYPDGQSAERQRQVLARAQLDPGKPSILVKHTPSQLAVAERAGIDFQFSGHTHCGQVWPAGWITQKVYGGYAFGLKRFGTMLEYTTCGVGTWGPPQRVGTTPEIVVATLRKL